MPDAYMVWMSYRNSGLPFVAGGFLDQPYAAMKIFNVCSAAVDRYQPITVPPTVTGLS